MISKPKKLLFLVSKPRVVRFLISSYYSGYLKDVGWFNSFEKKEPLDADGDPVAWVTYPFMHFIEPRLDMIESIFEYGSGNSTLYYSSFVGELVSVEHDRAWFEGVSRSMPENVQLYYCDLDENGEYSKFANTLKKKFDLIIVDGRDRVNCIKNSLPALSDRGILVLDDSEREQYEGGAEYLREHGFKRIDFWGFSPGLFYKKCTTIFYRDGNVLGI